nr:AAA family ATPase [bacterium]
MDKAEKLSALEKNIESVFLGKPGVVRQVMVALIARGHLLIEDVPGIGKTLLGIALSRSIAASFRRIQFTNDLLPSDILGVSTFNPKEGRFEFREGPIFSNIVLADEINRATPKTQSALLEAMSDMQVSIDGSPFPLPQPFMVIATQNPIEYHGTFPLPEARLGEREGAV